MPDSYGQTPDDISISVRAGYDGREAEITRQKGLVADVNDQLKTASQTITELRAQIVQLEAEIKELKDKYEKPSTYVGISLGGDRPGITQSDVVRVFLQGVPAGAKWSDQGAIKEAMTLSPKLIVLSWKETSSVNLQSFLATKPKDGVEFTGTYYHEPEDNVEDGSLKLADWRVTTKAHSAIVRAAGGKYGMILQRWTLSGGSHRDWHNYYEASVHDFIGWDAYNAGAKKGNYATPASIIDPCVAVATESGLPFLIGETGSPILPGGNSVQARASWAGELRSYCISKNAMAAAWWDAGTSTFNSKLDAATAKTWMGL